MQWIFPTEILLAIYNALVLPHINYCIISWGADSNTIFILQMKAVEPLLLLDTMRIRNYSLSCITY